MFFLPVIGKLDLNVRVKRKQIFVAENPLGVISF
jgi:hypothetical protein